MCASKLAIVLRRFDVVATGPRWEHFCMTSICVSYVSGFPFWSGRDLRLAKILVEGKRYALMRMYIQHPALDREDVCHQVGFGPWSSLCDSRSVWLCKPLARRVQWFEIGMSVSSQNCENVVRFTSRLKLEPQES